MLPRSINTMTSYTRSSGFTPSLPPLRSFAPPRVGTSPLCSSRLSGSSAAMDASTYSSSSRISSPPRSSRFQCTSYADYLRIKAMGGLPAPSHPPPPAPQRPIVFEHVATPWDPVPEFPDLSWHTISSSETYQTRTSTGSARTDTRTSALFYPRADLRLDAPVTSGRAAALPKPDPPAARWRPGTGNRLIVSFIALRDDFDDHADGLSSRRMRSCDKTQPHRDSVVSSPSHAR